MKIPLKEKLKFASIILGFTSLITQVILLREFLVIFYGNELVMGIILANWMLLTGIGAFTGKYIKTTIRLIPIIIILELFTGILPIITLFLLDYLRNIVFSQGVMLSIIEITYSSLILLLPFCFLSGLAFTFISSIYADVKKKNLINNIYAFESLGSLVGGLLFNLVLIYFLSPFKTMIMLLLINFIMAFILSYEIKKIIWKSLIIITGCISVFLLIYFNLDKISTSALFAGQKLLLKKDTPYGQIVVTKTSDQVNIFENGISLFSTNNTIENEENIHYALGQVPNSESILLLSGGITGTINEIMKYPNIKSIDYLELNPDLIKITKQFIDTNQSLLRSDKIQIINKDARLFFHETKTKYDAIILNLPDPTTAQINRFYTIDFIKECKEHLYHSGVLSLSLSSTGNYISEEAGELNASILTALRNVFENVIIIPGNQNYFIASDKQLTFNVTQVLSENNIQTDYVNEYYINVDLIKLRTKNIIQSLPEDAYINRDFHPIAYYYHTILWLSHFKIKLWMVALIIIIPIVIIVIKSTPVNLGLFAGGFTASSLEFLLLISFQIIYGYVYQMTGLIITIFMGGLAFGSFYLIDRIKTLSIYKFSKIQLIIGLCAIFTPLLMFLLQDIIIHELLVQIIFLFFTFIMASIIGLQFAVATKIQKMAINKLAATAYSADMLGSAFGALITAAILLPLLGLMNVGIILGGLNILVTAVILMKRKKYLNL